MSNFSIERVITEWQAAGIYQFLLPFLLIFAVIFGILSGTKAFGNHKGVHLIIALVIGLFAIQVPLVQTFFTEIFPGLGVGLAVMIVVWILVVVFADGTDHEQGIKIGMYILGAIISLFVVLNSFSNLSYFGSSWWEDWGSLIIGGIFIIGIIAAVALTGGKEK